MILFINACVRANSRTLILSKHLLSKLGPYEEIRLDNIDFEKTDEAFLNKRDSLISKGEFDNDMFKYARQFASADVIVIGAPYWDMSFPASLKQYVEKINVIGITFAYDEKESTVGLCKAKKLYYVTTSGGPDVSDSYGFGYIKAISDYFYKIPDVKLIQAKGLDVYFADKDKIMSDAVKEIDNLFK